jgi:RHS repeat-associated protein
MPGQDYANARYYSEYDGSFWSPDPGGMKTADTTDPTRWNRYGYVGGDPVNFIDPEGKFRCYPAVCEQPTDPIIDPTPTPPMPTPPPAPPARPKDATTDSSARFILRKRTANFGKSNCNKVFSQAIADYTTTDFTNEINIDKFYNVNASGVSNLTQNQVSDNGNNTTLGNSLAVGQTAATIINGSTPATLLGANFFSNTNATYQGNVLLHELLHAYTGWSDAEIFAAFSSNGLSNPNGDTEDISAWLSTDCKSTPSSITWWQQ